MSAADAAVELTAAGAAVWGATAASDAAIADLLLSRGLAEPCGDGWAFSGECQEAQT